MLAKLDINLYPLLPFPTDCCRTRAASLDTADVGSRNILSYIAILDDAAADSLTLQNIRLTGQQASEAPSCPPSCHASPSYQPRLLHHHRDTHTVTMSAYYENQQQQWGSGAPQNSWDQTPPNRSGTLLRNPPLDMRASYFLTLATATSSAAIPRENESNAFLSQFEGMLQSTSVGDGPGHASDGAMRHMRQQGEKIATGPIKRYTLQAHTD